MIFFIHTVFYTKQKDRLQGDFFDQNQGAEVIIESLEKHETAIIATLPVLPLIIQALARSLLLLGL